MEDLKTLRETIEEMEQFMNGAKPPHIQDGTQFGKCMVKVLREFHFRIEELEREIGKGPAFIDSSDVPHRLR